MDKIEGLIRGHAHIERVRERGTLWTWRGLMRHNSHPHHHTWIDIATIGERGQFNRQRVCRLAAASRPRVSLTSLELGITVTIGNHGWFSATHICEWDYICINLVMI